MASKSRKSKKPKSIEDHLRLIEFLIGGVLIKNGVPVDKVAKGMVVSKKSLTDMFPQKRKKRPMRLSAP